MPRPRRGMFRRGASWYWRDRSSGRDIWHSLGPDFGAAVEEYDRLHRMRGRGSDSRALVRDAAREWLRVDLPVRRVASGLKAVASSVARHLIPFLGATKLCDLRDDHVREYAAFLARQTDTRTGRTWKPSTVKHALDELRRFLRWCEETGRIDRSPFPRGIMPRIARGEPRPYTDAEIATLCSLPGDLGFLCRWGIESMLAWRDLATSTAAMIDERGLLTCTRAKTGQISLVPVSSAIRAEIRLRIGPLVRYGAKSSGSATRAIRAASGIADFTLHRLRHTGASLRLRQGWTLDEVKAMLGHASVTTTEVYAGATRRMLEEKAARMPAQTVANAVAGRKRVERVMR